MVNRMLCIALLGALVAAPYATADVITYNNDEAGYDAATGGDDLFEDFEGVAFEDADGNGTSDVEGDVFSSEVAYSTASNGSYPSRVNIGNIGGAVQNEIGPMGTWDGVLSWVYNAYYIATAFTGIELESGSVISFFDGETLVGSTAVGGTGGVFQFFGFVSDVAFNRVELSGSFFAIDAHRSTLGESVDVPEPGTIALLGIGLFGLGMTRRRRLA